MTTLAELARLIRSKNAGPFELTFDIMFDDAATYERVKRSGAVSREAVAARYGAAAEDVKFFLLRQRLAIKASIPRPYFQGDLLDSDGHGGQQYAPLMDIEIPCIIRFYPRNPQSVCGIWKCRYGSGVRKRFGVRTDKLVCAFVDELVTHVRQG